MSEVLIPDNELLKSYPGGIICIHSIQNPFRRPLTFVPLIPANPIAIDKNFKCSSISFNEWNRLLEHDFFGSLDIVATGCFFSSDNLIAFRTKYTDIMLVEGKPNTLEERTINITDKNSMVLTCAILNDQKELDFLTKAYHDNAIKYAFKTNHVSFF